MSFLRQFVPLKLGDKNDLMYNINDNHMIIFWQDFNLLKILPPGCYLTPVGLLLSDTYQQYTQKHIGPFVYHSLYIPNLFWKKILEFEITSMIFWLHRIGFDYTGFRFIHSRKLLKIITKRCQCFWSPGFKY